MNAQRQGHVISRGDRREDIFHDDVDRQDFIKRLAETHQKTGLQFHAFCLMRHYFHLVVDTPNGNLVEGMRWLLSTYTLRLNHRRKLFGHVFSGRYKALLVDGRSPGYLKTVCDYVHLNPARARLLGAGDRLLSYPWSSFSWYLAAPAHRPAWIRVDRLLGEHGIAADTAEGRQQFEQRLEACRALEDDGTQWASLRRGWCLGQRRFGRNYWIGWRVGWASITRGTAAGKCAGQGGAHHRRGVAPVGVERGRFGAKEQERSGETALAARLRRETTLTIKVIANRLYLGSWKSATTRLHHRKQKLNDYDKRLL